MKIRSLFSLRQPPLMVMIALVCIWNGRITRRSGILPVAANAAGHFPSRPSFAPSASLSSTKASNFETCSVLSSLSRSIRTLHKPSPMSVRVLHVQLVHRHGDRTPITPLKNETFWKETLPSPELLAQLESQTKVIRDKPNVHKAGGYGPFGQLTQLGLLQMVELGSKLTHEFHLEKIQEHATDHEGNIYLYHGRLFHPDFPLEPRHVKIVSTDFPRTLQSVQGVLVGLFPDSQEVVFEVDARHTSILIPDPQPRRSKEQEELELHLASRPYLLEKEEEMKDLALRTTEALLPLLGEGAFDVSFGVGEEKTHHSHHHRLAWTQLSEITKCLAVRNMLPPCISTEDQEAISSYAAWKWMEVLRHPRLAYLTMNPMLTTMVRSMTQFLNGDGPPLTIYSCHDSTLIGLLCAFRLDSPKQWPGYGAYLRVELIEVGSIRTDGQVTDKQHYVRFSLSGSVLRSQWSVDEPVELIPLGELERHIKTAGATTAEHHHKEHSIT